ncbi:MAG: DNA polymerase I [Lachnospiraceae bacterium]|nr:DNA polymerase I [Lachnospiraceae bacterium]
MSEKIVLIDGNSIMNRAFYGIPVLTNSQGIYTNAVYGFLNIVLKILEEEGPKYMVVAFDVKHPTFRHEMFDEYKGTRKGMPEELKAQMPIIKELLSIMQVKVIEKPGYEADDILGTIAVESEKNGLQVSLISGDRDLLQIATDTIQIRIPKTKRGGTEIENYYTKDVIEKYEVEPKQIIDLKGLMGDAADNIPGVPGIGEKTATKIIKEFGSVENAIENIDKVTPNRARENLRNNTESALMSKTLATIKTDCQLEYTLEEATIDNLFNEDTLNKLRELEFKNLLTRVSKKGNDSGGTNIQLDIIKVDDFAQCEKLFTDIIEQCGSKFDKGVENLRIEDAVSNATIFDSVVGIRVDYINDEFVMALSYEYNKVFLIREFGFITSSYLVDKVKELISNKVLVVFNNIKSQLRLLDNKESQYIEDVINKEYIVDIALADYLIKPLADSYNYDDISKDYIGLILPSAKEMLANKKEDNTEKLYQICCYDVSVCYKALKEVVAELHNTDMMDLYLDMELPLAYTLYDMEKRGIKVHREELSDYGKKLNERIEDLELLIYDLAGEKFNINSPKQLGVILFEKLQLPFAKKTKTGYSTSADVLEKLRCEHDIVKYVLEYRTLSKLKSTYADGLSSYIEDDLRIRSTFNQMITATGRISSTEPNLQNIPVRIPIGREIRKVFVPEDDYVFVDADYSQIELRVLAHLSEDEKLIDAYRANQDIHRTTASQVFNIPFDKVTDLDRRNAKAVNFGIVYGISSFGLGQDLNITRKEADSYIKSYFAAYPQLKAYLDKLVEDAKVNGYITTLFKRRRPIPELASSNFMQRSFGERAAMNSPIQGTAADIIKIAMIKVNNRLRREKLKSRLLLQIHDELLIETHKDEVEQVKEILASEMNEAAKLSVSLEVDMNVGNTWFDVK